jgi:hypothetical protein
MKTLLKLLGYLVATVVVVVGITLFAARFADGPWEIIAGGPFKTGTLQTTEPDWSFVKDYNTVEFQLVNPATSRTTWIAETDNRIFIPCGYMDTAWGRIWKQWPIQAQEDPRAILRVDGKLYERKLIRIKDDPALDVVLSELARKYFPGGADSSGNPRAAVESDSLWIFELVPR